MTILTMLVAALMLDLVNAYAVQTAARGSAILTVDALNLILVAGLVVLVMRQVLPIAARLAGGGALSTLGGLSVVGQRLTGTTRYVAVQALNAADNAGADLRTAVWRSASNGFQGRSP